MLDFTVGLLTSFAIIYVLLALYKGPKLEEILESVDIASTDKAARNKARKLTKNL